MGKSFKDLTSEERVLNNEKEGITESMVIAYFEKKGWIVKKVQKKSLGIQGTPSHLSILI